MSSVRGHFGRVVSRDTCRVVAKRRGRGPDSDAGSPLDLFSVGGGHVLYALDGLRWPDVDRFVVNRSQAHVGDRILGELATSVAPLVVAGFSGIATIVDAVDTWLANPAGGVFRFVLGSEPFPSTRLSFASPFESFDDEVRRYWLEERGVSIALSAKLVRAIEALDAGRLDCRAVAGATRLHAKIVATDRSVMIGSSNFTNAGLRSQIEANIRFDITSSPDDAASARLVGENYWQIATPWNEQLRALLDAMLRVVGWREALARAAADLLEGEWAKRYLDDLERVSSTSLWPSQRAGIAEALWVIDTVGSVLVADATGSGKTRMGAQLVRAVRDRMLSTGRTRNELMVLVCPPAVQAVWEREALGCGLNLQTASHGKLSRGVSDGERIEAVAVSQAQVLAVDEAHNFLNAGSNRTVLLRANPADHVALFTATPINRGPSDLLALVDLLGADNVDDETLDVLNRLDRSRNISEGLAEADVAVLRRAIGRFTVRRTKTALNAAVAREPEAYRDPITGRVARYPAHGAGAYPTGETDADSAAALRIRELTRSLRGIGLLERSIAVPDSLRNEYSDERWLEFRLGSVPGLATHQVLSALRSSTAALVEHIAGTDEAVTAAGLAGFKAVGTGNVLAKLADRAVEGPPEIGLSCDIPDWLGDPAGWVLACETELGIYSEILMAAQSISSRREQTKARLLIELAGRHDRVLAFDSHLITLEVVRRILTENQDPVVTNVALDDDDRRGIGAVGAVGAVGNGDVGGLGRVGGGWELCVATGANSEQTKTRFTRTFGRLSTTKAIGLCSDAMNEGINLQGASAIVHLDLPTTLRVAEQRVGRVDRMDSPHDRIEAWWPDDGPAFTTAANDLLAQRTAASDALLGANLPIPALAGAPSASIRAVIAAADQTELSDWDGLRDALSPVRELIGPPTGLLTPNEYELHRHTEHRILAHVAPVTSARPWMFMAVTSTGRGAPRWILCPGPNMAPVTDLGDVCARLRTMLGDDPPDRPIDETVVEWINRFVDVAKTAERALMPRRLQRALEQLHTVTTQWAVQATRARDEHNAAMWRSLAAIASNQHDVATGDEIDPYALGQRWIDLIRPRLDARRQRQRRRYQLLSDITPDLIEHPIAAEEARRALTNLPLRPPLTDRITAAIIGVPNPENTEPADPTIDTNRGTGFGARTGSA
jgi:hypothetical protein